MVKPNGHHLACGKTVPCLIVRRICYVNVPSLFFSRDSFFVWPGLVSFHCKLSGKNEKLAIFIFFNFLFHQIIADWQLWIWDLLFKFLMIYLCNFFSVKRQLNQNSHHSHLRPSFCCCFSVLFYHKKKMVFVFFSNSEVTFSFHTSEKKKKKSNRFLCGPGPPINPLLIPIFGNFFLSESDPSPNQPIHNVTHTITNRWSPFRNNRKRIYCRMKTVFFFFLSLFLLLLLRHFFLFHWLGFWCCCGAVCAVAHRGLFILVRTVKSTFLLWGLYVRFFETKSVTLT